MTPNYIKFTWYEPLVVTKKENLVLLTISKLDTKQFFLPSVSFKKEEESYFRDFETLCFSLPYFLIISQFYITLSFIDKREQDIHNLVNQINYGASFVYNILNFVGRGFKSHQFFFNPEHCQI